MRTFVFLHVLTMFGAVAISGGIDLLILRIAKTHDIASIHSAFEARYRIGRFIPVLFGTGLVFGLIAIFVEHFDPFAGWLLLAYPLFVAGILTGLLGIARWAERVRVATATATQGDPEVIALLDTPSVRYATAVFWLLIAALVFVMIMKPSV
ncbi:MAG TPA: hypothetical protein VJ975_05550 [Candidatus Limnocylindria bacterium]|nr:hypothetical protein [Candidatus Limnocylindria bacterium]